MRSFGKMYICTACIDIGLHVHAHYVYLRFDCVTPALVIIACVRVRLAACKSRLKRHRAGIKRYGVVMNGIWRKIAFTTHPYT